jgi:hypothetical protein
MQYGFFDYIREATEENKYHGELLINCGLSPSLKKQFQDNLAGLVRMTGGKLITRGELDSIE